MQLRKIITAIVLCLLLPYCHSYASNRGDNKAPATEAALADTILSCMRYEDTLTYPNLFMPFDTLWQRITDYRPQDDYEIKEMDYLRQHPERIQKFDPAHNPDIVKNYYYVLKKGRDSGVHWSQVTLLRYELKRMKLTRDLLGFEHIAPVRFEGFIFIKDLLTRRIYAFTVREMQYIDGHWYGGQVLNIYEAADQDEFWAKQEAELKLMKKMKEFGLTLADLQKGKDKAKSDKKASSSKGDEDDDDDKAASKQDDADSALAVNTDIYDDDASDHANKKATTRISKKEVVDRKLFEGTFDNQIPVRVYIRYLKGNCPEGICAWEAIYKFGDQDEYIKLDVTKTKDGKWSFVEDPPIGSMDLVQKNDTFTGNWLSTDIKTGYDVKLHEVPLTAPEARELDKIIQTGAWAKGRKGDEDRKEKEIKPISADITNGVY